MRVIEVNKQTAIVGGHRKSNLLKFVDKLPGRVEIEVQFNLFFVITMNDLLCYMIKLQKIAVLCRKMHHVIYLSTATHKK